MWNPSIPRTLFPPAAASSQHRMQTFCRFLASNFSHTSPLKKLVSQKIGDSLLQKGCFAFHIHHPCMTFSSNLLSPQIKTHTGLQAQIGICKSSCALSAARLPPGTRRPAVVIHVGVSSSLEPVAGSAYLPGIFLRDF